MRTFKSAFLLAVLFGTSSAVLAADTKGYLYGTVLTKSGTTYEGRLRWAKEEAFWTDHFNATKEERPLVREVPTKHRHRGEHVKILGVPVGMRWMEDEGRQLVVRFGDLKSILPRRGNEGTLVLRSGEEIEIGGGSNDVGAKITVWDRSVGDVQVTWDKIRRIDFKAAPADLQSVPARLHGTVKTTSGTLKGFIQWDKEECLATDLLDGETEDGKLAVEMGKIKAIERRGRNSSDVILKDGRTLNLRGTNDVDSDNRGLFVDDPRYGRVLVAWTAFERVDFEDAGSGPGYDSFPSLGALRGTVTKEDGSTLKGKLVYDVDEAEGWETLDGENDGLTYSIPFAMVSSISPMGSSRSKVTLKGSTEELRLEDSADVSDRNAGVFVLDGDRKTYVPWDDVKRIDFDR